MSLVRKMKPILEPFVHVWIELTLLQSSQAGLCEYENDGLSSRKVGFFFAS
jgi:hypothetical protein